MTGGGLLVMRLARRDEAGAIARVQNASFPQCWDANEIGRLMDIPGALTMVAADAAQGIVAYLMLSVTAPEAEIISIAVDPIRRRQGLGAALLRCADAELRARGVKALFLDVAADNDPAIALYAGEGFCERGRRKRYYQNGADALVLMRDIA